MSTKLNKVSECAKHQPKAVFTSLAHLLSLDFLKETWRQVNKQGASGIDGITADEYEENLESNLETLIKKLKEGKYRAPLIRQVEIPKPGKKDAARKLGISTIEDRLLQRAVSRILIAIFDNDFSECSYGFRPNRNAHQALKQLRMYIACRKVRNVFEADIKSYFDKVNHEWLLRMLKQRINDRVILRLIGKWLKAGVMSNGTVHTRNEGCPQGGPISCVLSNIYLHYVLDIWFEKKIKPMLKGECYLVRFVDDFVLCFEHREEMLVFEQLLRERLGKFSLSLKDEKTKGFIFGRFARADLQKQRRKPETFEFLGFKHVCGKSRNGKFDVIQIPSIKSCNKFCDRTYLWLRKHQHWHVKDQQKQLSLMLKGFYQYFSLLYARSKLALVHMRVIRQWRRVLYRRSQRNPYRYWSFLKSRSWFNLPAPLLNRVSN